ncbi:MAG: phosphate signaling complex protein PhoU [Chitinispirillaceae bacterium]
MEIRTGKEIEHIRELVVRMATYTEESVSDAISAFLTLDAEKAQSVIAKDGEINSMERVLDRDAFECLALRAPVASDLRLLISMMKMNKDLERIGDHAVNIAQSAINCLGFGRPMNGPDIQLMSSLTERMLSDAINCFVNSDTQLALSVMEHDDLVDDLNRSVSREVIETVKKDVTTVEAALELMRVSKNLERISDLCTNIAEDVIFHAKAKDIKHTHVAEEMKEQPE